MFWPLKSRFEFLGVPEDSQVSFSGVWVITSQFLQSRVATVNVHKICSWIGLTVLLDATMVGSCAHHPRLWWTNLLSREVLRRAYEIVPRSSHLIVDIILDIGRCSQVVRVANRSPMALVNRVGQPRMALPTFVSFLTSHAYREGGPGLVWDTCLQRSVEPNVDERECVRWGFL